MTKAIVLIETEVGKAKAVSSALISASENGFAGRILAVDMVTGPFDVIATIQDKDLDKVGNLITDEIQKVPGVQRTHTCLTVKLS